MGKKGRNHPFNIFGAAFAINNCRIYCQQTRHLTGTDAAQIMLKCGIFPHSNHRQFGKALIINTLQKRKKEALFPSKMYADRKTGKDLRLFCDKRLAKQLKDTG